MRPDAKFVPGFRIFELDGGIILRVFCESPSLMRLLKQLAVAALFAREHFAFLCNVLCAKRALELLWAVALSASGYPRTSGVCPVSRRHTLWRWL